MAWKPTRVDCCKGTQAHKRNSRAERDRHHAGRQRCGPPRGESVERQGSGYQYHQQQSDQLWARGYCRAGRGLPTVTHDDHIGSGQERLHSSGGRRSRCPPRQEQGWRPPEGRSHRHRQRVGWQASDHGKWAEAVMKRAWVMLALVASGCSAAPSPAPEKPDPGTEVVTAAPVPAKMTPSTPAAHERVAEMWRRRGWYCYQYRNPDGVANYFSDCRRTLVSCEFMMKK